MRGWQTEKFLADVYLEGKLAVKGKTIEHRKGHFVINLPARVADGRLDVTFKGNWWQLCALTIGE